MQRNACYMYVYIMFDCQSGFMTITIFIWGMCYFINNTFHFTHSYSVIRSLKCVICAIYMLLHLWLQVKNSSHSPAQSLSPALYYTEREGLTNSIATSLYNTINNSYRYGTSGNSTGTLLTLAAYNRIQAVLEVYDQYGWQNELQLNNAWIFWQPKQ